MNTSEKIVLASASPRRRRMFDELELEFEVIPAGIDERMRNGESPESFTMRAAKEKGAAVVHKLDTEGRQPWIVAADTVVVLSGDILVKPRDQEDARKMLTRLSGETHSVVTGWVVGRRNEPWIVEHEKTEVTFHDLTKEQIDNYVATGEGMDKAGAYAIQGLGAFLVDSIKGNYLNVVGLPISHVVRALIQVGVLPTFPVP